MKNGELMNRFQEIFTKTMEDNGCFNQIQAIYFSMISKEVPHDKVNPLITVSSRIAFELVRDYLEMKGFRLSLDSIKAEACLSPINGDVWRLELKDKADSIKSLCELRKIERSSKKRIKRIRIPKNIMSTLGEEDRTLTTTIDIYDQKAADLDIISKMRQIEEERLKEIGAEKRTKRRRSKKINEIPSTEKTTKSRALDLRLRKGSSSVAPIKKMANRVFAEDESKKLKTKMMSMKVFPPKDGDVELIYLPKTAGGQSWNLFRDNDSNINNKNESTLTQSHTSNQEGEQPSLLASSLKEYGDNSIMKSKRVIKRNRLTRKKQKKDIENSETIPNQSKIILVNSFSIDPTLVKKNQENQGKIYPGISNQDMSPLVPIISYQTSSAPVSISEPITPEDSVENPKMDSSEINDLNDQNFEFSSPEESLGNHEEIADNFEVGSNEGQPKYPDIPIGSTKLIELKIHSMSDQLLRFSSEEEQTGDQEADLENPIITEQKIHIVSDQGLEFSSEEENLDSIEETAGIINTEGQKLHIISEKHLEFSSEEEQIENQDAGIDQIIKPEAPIIGDQSAEFLSEEDNLSGHGDFGINSDACEEEENFEYKNRGLYLSDGIKESNIPETHEEEQFESNLQVIVPGLSLVSKINTEADSNCSNEEHIASKSAENGIIPSIEEDLSYDHLEDNTIRIIKMDEVVSPKELLVLPNKTDHLDEIEEDDIQGLLESISAELEDKFFDNVKDISEEEDIMNERSQNDPICEEVFNSNGDNNNGNQSFVNGDSYQKTNEKNNIVQEKEVSAVIDPRIESKSPDIYPIKHQPLLEPVMNSCTEEESQFDTDKGVLSIVLIEEESFNEINQNLNDKGYSEISMVNADKYPTNISEEKMNDQINDDLLNKQNNVEIRRLKPNGFDSKEPTVESVTKVSSNSVRNQDEHNVTDHFNQVEPINPNNNSVIGTEADFDRRNSNNLSSFEEIIGDLEIEEEELERKEIVGKDQQYYENIKNKKENSKSPQTNDIYEEEDIYSYQIGTNDQNNLEITSKTIKPDQQSDPFPMIVTHKEIVNNTAIEEVYEYDYQYEYVSGDKLEEESVLESEIIEEEAPSLPIANRNSVQVPKVTVDETIESIDTKNRDAVQTVNSYVKPRDRSLSLTRKSLFSVISKQTRKDSNQEQSAPHPHPKLIDDDSELIPLDEIANDEEAIPLQSSMVYGENPEYYTYAYSYEYENDGETPIPEHRSIDDEATIASDGSDRLIRPESRIVPNHNIGHPIENVDLSQPSFEYEYDEMPH